MKILFDTSFIISCIKKKINFLDAEKFGRLILPLEVTEEIKKLSEKSRGKERENAALALGIIEKNKEKFELVSLNEKNVDEGIISYADKNQVAVATLDRELKKSLKNKAGILVIRAGKKIQLQ